MFKFWNFCMSSQFIATLHSKHIFWDSWDNIFMLQKMKFFWELKDEIFFSDGPDAAVDQTIGLRKRYNPIQSISLCWSDMATDGICLERFDEGGVDLLLRLLALRAHRFLRGLAMRAVLLDWGEVFLRKVQGSSAHVRRRAKEARVEPSVEHWKCPEFTTS